MVYSELHSLEASQWDNHLISERNEEEVRN